MLDSNKEPILITKGKKIRAVLIRYEDFETRFLDKQADEEKERFLNQIKNHRSPSLAGEDPLATLRALRGYAD